MPEVLTPQQVADYLQMSTDTVYRLIRQRKLAAARIGRDYRIPKEDLESFLLAHSTRSEVRARLFERVLSIADRNPGLNSEDVLDELEAMDEIEKAKPSGR
jgi:excisionase family DNA binding protein